MIINRPNKNYVNQNGEFEREASGASSAELNATETSSLSFSRSPYTTAAVLRASRASRITLGFLMFWGRAFHNSICKLNHNFYIKLPIFYLAQMKQQIQFKLASWALGAHGLAARSTSHRVRLLILGCPHSASSHSNNSNTQNQQSKPKYRRTSSQTSL